MSDVTPPTGDPTKTDDTPRSAASGATATPETAAGTAETRREVFDLAKMSPRDIANELARRSKPTPQRPPAAVETDPRSGEPLTASGLSDAEVAAFFAPMPRLFNDRREHDHSDPAYAALRDKMTAAAADDEADDHDPMDALSKALASRLAARTAIQAEPPPPTAAAKDATAVAKIIAVMAKREAAATAKPVTSPELVHAEKVAPDLTMPPMPSLQAATPAQQVPPGLPASQPGNLQGDMMTSPLHIPALLTPFATTDATGLPQVPPRARAAEKPFAEPVLRRPLQSEQVPPETVKPDLEQSIAAALALAPPAGQPDAVKAVAEELTPPPLLTSIVAPPLPEERETTKARRDQAAAKPSPIRRVKASGRMIPVQSLMERLRGLQRDGFRWDILAGGVLIGSVLAAIPVIFLMPQHRPVAVMPAAQVAAAPASTTATPMPATPAPAETIIPPPPPVPVISAGNNTGQGTTPGATPPNGMTPEQADKLLQSAQSLSTAAGPTAAAAGTAPATTAGATATATPNAATPATTTKPVSSTVKKPATTKKKTTKPKPAVDPQLSPAKR